MTLPIDQLTMIRELDQILQNLDSIEKMVLEDPSLEISEKLIPIVDRKFCKFLEVHRIQLKEIQDRLSVKGRITILPVSDKMHTIREKLNRLSRNEQDNYIDFFRKLRTCEVDS